MSRAGRNDPCPCGSGKKYKHCCFARDQNTAAGVREATASVANLVRDGVVHLNAGRLADAEAVCRRILGLDPQHAGALHMLGVIALQAGRHDLAAELIANSLRVNPENPHALVGLGNALKGLGQPDRAIACYARATELNPALVDAHVNLGSALAERGMPADAIASYRRALQLNPAYAEVHYNAANALADLGMPDQAIASYRRALELKPQLAAAHNNLGKLLRGLGHFDDAITSFRRALEVNPVFPEAHNNLGNVYASRRNFTDAMASYQRALELRPDYAEACANLANTLRDLGRLDEAEAHCRRALEIKPALVDAHLELAGTLMALGQLDAAETGYRCALQLKPDLDEAMSTLISSMNYSRHTAQRCLEEARRYGVLVSAKAGARFVEWEVQRPPVRLRVGMVSGDLREHVVSYFLERVLANVDQAVVELYAYPTVDVFDELSTRIRPLFAAWKPLVGLSDEAAARMIHDDAVHVLIDLSGHTTYSRLPVFAWKPAPVQVSWLGYFATTGVAEMDYFIADPWTLPPGEEVHFSEKIWRLPDTRLCFTAPDLEVSVSVLPALANGYVTFGCFNNLTKLNDEVVALWSRVLQAVPESRLYLKARQLRESTVRRRLVERFAVRGIDAQRLIVEGPGSRAEYLAAYQRVDITLDPFPFTGGTTSAESLWMGVPVLTLAGERLVSRQGVGLLMNAGLPEWIAQDGEDYVRRAVAHAGDRDGLARLRQGLRAQVLASPLFDAARFARNLESALFGMWQNLCADVAH